MPSLNTSKISEQIFICYRREDSADNVDRIYERLSTECDPGKLFWDIESIPAGVQFSRYIKQTLSRCSVVLVVIGRDWLEIRSDDGRRRLEDPKDQLRIEIETSLGIPDLPIIPVLVRSALMPSAEAIPESIRELAHRNGLRVRPSTDFEPDMLRLIQKIREAITSYNQARAARAEQSRASAVSPLPSRVPDDDLFWDDLLMLIEEERVIPVIGERVVTTSPNEDLLYPSLASQLGERLNIELPPNQLSLDEVVFMCLTKYGGSMKPYLLLKRILSDKQFFPGSALREIADIPAFNLFITTTFDDLLERAINEMRFSGALFSYSIAFASTSSQPQDLPAEKSSLSRPTIFHLFGRIGAQLKFAISESDLLEFLYLLTQQWGSMPRLARELRDNSLLILGLKFPEWLLAFSPAGEREWT